MQLATKRRLPIGAEVISLGETHFRVWAPKATKMAVAVEESAEPNAPRKFFSLEPEADGYFSGKAPVGAGALYRFRLDDGEQLYPDPASRFQPEGPHRSSSVVDPATFEWTDEDWPGARLKGQIVYEFHVGTFTPEGTWTAAAEQLPELARVGITLLEVMPIADFPGAFGWGYDGVNLFAPSRLYGPPDDLRRFVDQAHSLGMGVILDVVYNHLGPDGNYLGIYSDHYLTRDFETEWGEPINFCGHDCEAVREFFISNARHWVGEYHFDGFRFDATHSIFDHSPEHILAAIAKAARAEAGERNLVLIAESEKQEATLVRPNKQGGYGFDGIWNDDFHHAALVALTGRNPAYYTDYQGRPQEFISAAKYGFLFQGQRYHWQKKRRGSPSLDLPPETFVAYLENHDQVANSPDGARVRLLTSPGRYRAITALQLLGPWTPLLFQGQEYGARTPFLYFADVNRDLQEAVRKGRFDFLKQFPGVEAAEVQKQLPLPWAPETFERCKLDLSERGKHPQISRLFEDLIKLRRSDRVFAAQGKVDGAVLGHETFVLRFFDSLGKEDRLLLVNLGRDLELRITPEPLLAPPAGHDWEKLWSSEAVCYGGRGALDPETAEGWRFPAESLLVLRARNSGRE